MQKLIMLGALLALGIGAGTARAAERTVTLTVEKMYCESCPLTVRKAIEGVKGVKSAKVDYKSKTAVVTFDDAVTNTQAITEATMKAGYPSAPKG